MPKHREFIRSLIKKVRKILIFAGKISSFSNLYLEAGYNLPSQFHVCNSHKSLNFEKIEVLTGKKQGI